MAKIKKVKILTEKEYLHYLIDNTNFKGMSKSLDVSTGEGMPASTDITLLLEDIGNVTQVIDDHDIYYNVEVEEEITEETVIPKLVERYESYGESTYVTHENECIEVMKDESTIAFYIEHEDDLSLELIWSYEELV